MKKIEVSGRWLDKTVKKSLNEELGQGWDALPVIPAGYRLGSISSSENSSETPTTTSCELFSVTSSKDNETASSLPPLHRQQIRSVDNILEDWKDEFTPNTMQVVGDLSACCEEEIHLTEQMESDEALSDLKALVNHLNLKTAVVEGFLTYLRKHFSVDLPKTRRTLMSTPQKAQEFEILAGGAYYHISLPAIVKELFERSLLRSSLTLMASR